jgi:GT2 family glycosyltransferase/glycosyltransferase involved in cell wall biosynthesis
VTRPSVALVVHGAYWPDSNRATALRDQWARISGTTPDVIVTRDEPSRPRGAAACIIDAVQRTSADVVVAADSSSSLDDAVLGTLWARVVRPHGEGTAGSGRGDDAMASIGPLDLPVPPLDGTDLVASMATYVDAPLCAGDDPACWVVRRDAWEAAGGLDARLWSIGAVADLAARLRALGHRTGTVPMANAPTTAASYPLSPDVRTLLAWRNGLISLVKTSPADTLGPSMTLLLTALLGAAWRGTGLRADDVTFGGAWGRASMRQRLQTRLGGRPAGDIWPADELATALPLAAIQSFSMELPALLEERRAMARTLDGPIHERARARAATPASMPQRVDFRTRPRVSVIVVTWNGLEHLDACFSSVLASDYPTDLLEVVCVDNGSTDGTAAFLAQRFPTVRVVALPENRGFTGGNAAGVAAASGDVLVFLNNDMRVEPTLVSRLVDGLEGDAACAGARVMSWDGQRIDFVRGTASFEARGFQELYQQRFQPGMQLADSFFPNGGAFAVTRAAYDDAGGFDARLFAYYDDLDLGWRLRAAGCAIRTVPDAVAYHRHGATVRTQPNAHKRWLMERNALWIALRNYDEDALPQVAPALLLLAGLRIAQHLAWLRSPTARRLRPWLPSSRAATPARDVYLAREGGTQDAVRTPVRVLAGVPMPELVALGNVLSHLPALRDDRRATQARRRRPDAEVLPHLGRPFEALDGRTSYRRTQRALIDLLHLKQVIGQRSHVLLVTHEALRRNMSGPAVRVLEMGRALSRSARVTIAAPGPVEISDARLAIVPYDPAAPDALRAQAESADTLVVQGFALHSYPFLTRLVAPLVVDLYCPFTLEYLEQTRTGQAVVDPQVAREARAILDVQNAQLQFGDLFLCASERQRDFWVGALHTAGRVNADTLAHDPDLRRLVTVVPFGLPAEPIEAAHRRAQALRVQDGRPAGVLKGVHPAIGPNDKVLLWGGSLLDWQDPETLIDAVAQLRQTRDDVRLFFMGVRHPNPQVKPMAIVERARTRARAAGLLDTHVIFNDWVPYDERAAYLREADIGVSTHRQHLETRYSFRTRMLDYLWAGLPIVCTEGDFFGDLVQREGLGRAVPPNDPSALAEALSTMLDAADARASARRAIERVAASMTWDAVTAPLRDFCAAPEFAADRAPQVERLHAALARSFRGTHLLKRTLLQAGVGEGQIEAVKRWKAVQQAMTLRNKAALWRARRRARVS